MQLDKCSLWVPSVFARSFNNNGLPVSLLSQARFPKYKLGNENGLRVNFYWVADRHGKMMRATLSINEQPRPFHIKGFVCTSKFMSAVTLKLFYVMAFHLLFYVRLGT